MILLRLTKVIPFVLLSQISLVGCPSSPQGIEDPYSISQGIKDVGLTDTRMDQDFAEANLKVGNILILPLHSSVMANTLSGLKRHPNQADAMSLESLKEMTALALDRRGYQTVSFDRSGAVMNSDVQLFNDYLSVRKPLFVPKKIDIEVADTFDVELSSESKAYLKTLSADAVFIISYAKWLRDDAARDHDLKANLAIGLVSAVLGGGGSNIQHRSGEYFEAALIHRSGKLLWSRMIFRDFFFDGGVIDWSLEQMPNFGESASEMRIRIMKQAMGCDRPGTTCF